MHCRKPGYICKINIRYILYHQALIFLVKLYNDLQLSDFSYGHVRIRLNLRVLDIVNISSMVFLMVLMYEKVIKNLFSKNFVLKLLPLSIQCAGSLLELWKFILKYLPQHLKEIKVIRGYLSMKF